jgi:tetratricopeptide (TPR) repeat protein
VVQHIAETHGEPKLQQMVRSYSRGITDEQAVSEALGQTMEQLQASFDASMEKKYATVREALKRPKFDGAPELDELKKMAEANAGSFAVQVALGQALEKAGDHAGAIAALERAATLLPRANGDENPNKFIARIAEAQGDIPRTIRALQEVVKVDHTDVESARKLASLVAQAKDNPGLEDAYRRIINVDPFDSAAQSGLGRLLMGKRDHASAARAFRSALASKPADPAVAHVDLAEAYLALGQPAEAKTATLQALEIAPSFERAQDLLLKLVDAAER